MNLENDSEFRHRSDDRLGEILEESERRKEAEWKEKGRKTTLIVGIPMIVLILWAVVFLLKYQPANPPVVKNVPVAKQAAPTEAEDPQFDAFRPKALRVGKQEGGAEKPSGPIIDKGDIEFAMQLLNYVQPPAKPEPKH